MPKIKSTNPEQLLIKKYQNIKYFCPHPQCRFLFNDIHNDHKVKVVKQGYDHQCIHCKRYFNRSTYRDKRKCGRPYQIDKTSNRTKDEYLEFHIGKLWSEGYTNREIHTITLFSRVLIGKITKKFRDQVIDICTIEEFSKKYLSDLDNKYPLISWRDLRTHKIRKAFRLGCSVSQIAKILKIGNNTIVNAKRGNYRCEDKKDSFYLHVDPKKKILTEEESKFTNATEDFLKNAEPPITNKNQNNKNRTIITITTDGKVRVKGTKEK